MQEKPYRDELETRATETVESMRASLMEKLQARKSIERELATMADEGKVRFLSQEEEDLLKGFRKFKANLVRGTRGTFQFRTSADDREIVPGNEAGLIEEVREP